jgi:membrane protein implicated in regulation of membrane protease activity
LYLLLEHPVLPFDSISFLNAYAKSHVQPFWPWKVMFYLFALCSVSVVIYFCRALFLKRKERSHYEKRVFAPATPSPTTDEGSAID